MEVVNIQSTKLMKGLLQHRVTMGQVPNGNRHCESRRVHAKRGLMTGSETKQSSLNLDCFASLAMTNAYAWLATLAPIAACAAASRATGTRYGDALT